MFIIKYEEKDKKEVPMMTNLREQDDKFRQIQQLIDAKKDMLVKKQKRLQCISKQNKFLENVKDDYSHYYSYIAQQKKDQLRALGILDQYIKDLSLQGQLTTYNIEDATHEQAKILQEMKKIQTSLDELIDGAGALRSTKV